jgi:hypothetical protein
MITVEHKSDVVEFKGFFSREEAKDLVDYFESSPSSWELTCFYNARVMDPLEPYKLGTSPRFDESFMKSLRVRLQDVAQKVFSKNLVNLSLSAHKWLPGAFASYHSDNTELDGKPNAWRENKLVTIIYLNDDYEGGHLVFRDHEIDIAPEAGTVVVFDVGIDNVHAVTEVVSGQRWTMLASFDYEGSTYPPEYWEEKKRETAEALEYNAQQHKDWESRKS